MEIDGLAEEGGDMHMWYTIDSKSYHVYYNSIKDEWLHNCIDLRVLEIDTRPRIEGILLYLCGEKL